MPYDIQLTIALRLILAFLFGLIIGWERTSQQKPAGSRTHGLVCLASALFMIISTYGFLDFPGQKDPARLAAQVVTGMGFIGAGAIWREGSWVRGLTTASTLWVSSALGLALGIGLYIPATVTLILAYCTLQLYTLKKILTGRDEWLERVQVYEALDLESLKIALEELFSCPIHVSTFSASDLYAVNLTFPKSYHDPFTLTLTFKGDTVTVALLYIPTALRRRGYATTITNLVVNWARKNGFRAINLTSKEEISELWLKCGFKPLTPTLYHLDLQ